MRTTLVLDDQLMRLAKKRAAAENKTLSKLVEESVRSFLLAPKRGSRTRFRLKLPTVRGRLLPGVDLADRDSLYERMEGRA